MTEPSPGSLSFKFKQAEATTAETVLNDCQKLPPGFPPYVEGAQLLDPRDYKESASYVLNLSESDIKALEQALITFKSKAPSCE